MKIPALTPLAASLPATVPFVGPETSERLMGRAFTARLGANESLFGPSPLAVKAMQAAAAQVWMYGDPELYDLKQALAAHHGCAPENIVVGEGIDGLLGYLARLMIEPWRSGGDLSRGLSDLQLPCRGLWRHAAPRALQGRFRGPAGAA